MRSGEDVITTVQIDSEVDIIDALSLLKFIVNHQAEMIDNQILYSGVSKVLGERPSIIERRCFVSTLGSK